MRRTAPPVANLDGDWDFVLDEAIELDFWPLDMREPGSEGSIKPRDDEPD
jgi:hypothetical protein